MTVPYAFCVRPGDRRCNRADRSRAVQLGVCHLWTASRLAVLCDDQSTEAGPCWTCQAHTNVVQAASESLLIRVDANFALSRLLLAFILSQHQTHISCSKVCGYKEALLAGTSTCSPQVLV